MSSPAVLSATRLAANALQKLEARPPIAAASTPAAFAANLQDWLATIVDNPRTLDQFFTRDVTLNAAAGHYTYQLTAKPLFLETLNSYAFSPELEFTTGRGKRQAHEEFIRAAAAAFAERVVGEETGFIGARLTMSTDHEKPEPIKLTGLGIALDSLRSPELPA
jgi:hypothetical protein